MDKCIEWLHSFGLSNDTIVKEFNAFDFDILEIDNMHFRHNSLFCDDFKAQLI